MVYVFFRGAHYVDTQIFASLSARIGIFLWYRWWSTLPIELITESISFKFFSHFQYSSKKESNRIWALTFLLFLFLFIVHSFDHGCLIFFSSRFFIACEKNEKRTMGTVKIHKFFAFFSSQNTKMVGNLDYHMYTYETCTVLYNVHLISLWSRRIMFQKLFWRKTCR